MRRGVLLSAPVREAQKEPLGGHQVVGADKAIDEVFGPIKLNADVQRIAANAGDHSFKGSMPKLDPYNITGTRSLRPLSSCHDVPLSPWRITRQVQQVCTDNLIHRRNRAAQRTAPSSERPQRHAVFRVGSAQLIRVAVRDSVSNLV